ncbi:adenosine deaminase family protein [Simiduia aestuariiviva]|uniref:Adenosine deaminase CECR1 n=1 Tax=Simiduia aestuariiviva TaxID=1510459 RepID=A0A839UVT8_9GAMM|nr:adenosine deaminase [Simiduia aestuariiviva]MBB3169477.1 adenosine deaminase CECR1 [Simiduia aestuariiviva]
MQHSLTRQLTAWALRLAFIGALSPAAFASDWFEEIKTKGSDKALYELLYAMPKGGDLHHHLSGSAFSDWWYTLALAEAERGYRYFTKVRINNCRGYGENAYSFQPYHLLFQNISSAQFDGLPECEKTEYKRLEDLNAEEKTAWLNSIRLDKPHEGRDEFFQTHWSRLGALLANPYLFAELLVRNMQAYRDEGLVYLETMVETRGFARADGTPLTPDEVVDVYRQRLQQKDARATGVTVRLHDFVLRFLPNAEQQVIDSHGLVYRNRDIMVGVNMVGREDNAFGHPLRFNTAFREARKQYPNVRLAIHAGEVDEPNTHIRDTLALGADRIGHGLNLITDRDLLRQMRHGPYLVEINLISNLLLDYYQNFDEHPFPEYLRLGIPVALSTDDRGMWDSNYTDEFFAAVKSYNLSWEEVKLLSRNSLAYGFVEDDIKQKLLADFDKRMAKFEKRAARQSAAEFERAGNAKSYGFTCRQFKLCL